MDLTQLLVKAKSERKKLDIVIGDGIDPMLDLHNIFPPEDRHFENPNPNIVAKKDSNCWKYFEHVRLMTTNARPIESYQFVFHLVNCGIAKSVITTNYDMTLDTVWENLSKEMVVDVVKNPILNSGESDFTQFANRKGSDDSVEFWKIHGCLSKVICRECLTVLQCPDFVVPFGSLGAYDITDEFIHPLSHRYLPNIAKCCPVDEAEFYLHSQRSLCGNYVHCVDWNLKKFKELSPFNKIIESAMTSLQKDPFGIIFIGFKGNKDDEAINKVVEELDGKGVLFAMYLSDSQKVRVENGAIHCHLRDLILKNGGHFEYLKEEDIARKLLGSLVDGKIAPLDDLVKFENLFHRNFINPTLYLSKRRV